MTGNRVGVPQDFKKISQRHAAPNQKIACGLGKSGVLCAECGAGIDQLGVGRPRKFCSQDCSRAFHGKRRGKHSSGNARNSCKSCNSPFVRAFPNQSYCSPVCRERKKSPYKMGSVTKCCAMCSSNFNARHPLHMTCSAHCRKQLKLERSKERHKRTDVRVSTRIRTSMRRSIRDRKGGRAWESTVGYSLSDLMAHLQSKFVSGMSWENLSDWHIDHIRPIASFDIKSFGDSEFKKAWSIENLQPLFARENMSKGARYGISEEAN